jgi:RNHCP domain
MRLFILRARCRRPWRPVAFRCERCGWSLRLRGGSRTAIAINCCPRCHWSKHVMYGWEDYEPCGALMAPLYSDDGVAAHECVGCGYLDER